MKIATVREIKLELKDKNQEELIGICLDLSKFKKENKELLTYLLFEKENEEEYIDSIKEEIALLFQEIQERTLYHKRKGVRKILRITKKYIRYSKNKETEVELLIFYISEIKQTINYCYTQSKVLLNIYDKQIEFVKKKIKLLHEDLQYDYSSLLNGVIE